MTLLPISSQRKHSYTAGGSKTTESPCALCESQVQKILDFGVPALSSPTLLQPFPPEPCRRHWCPKASHPPLVPLCAASCPPAPEQPALPQPPGSRRDGGNVASDQLVKTLLYNKNTLVTLCQGVLGGKATRQIPALCEEPCSHPQGGCRVTPAPKLCPSACTLAEQPPGTSPGPF